MIIRAHLKLVDNADLDTMWDEIVAWEINGTLPIEATLRQVTREAFAGGIPRDDVGLLGTYCLMTANEVWREIAVRATGRKT